MKFIFLVSAKYFLKIFHYFDIIIPNNLMPCYHFLAIAVYFLAKTKNFFIL